MAFPKVRFNFFIFTIMSLLPTFKSGKPHFISTFFTFHLKLHLKQDRGSVRNRATSCLILEALLRQVKISIVGLSLFIAFCIFGLVYFAEFCEINTQPLFELTIITVEDMKPSPFSFFSSWQFLLLFTLVIDVIFHTARNQCNTMI